MPANSGPRNLGISQRLAVLVACVGAGISVAGIAIAAIAFGVDETTSPIVLAIAGTLGTMILGLVTALKASEAADTSSRAKQVAEFTASQNAMLQQVLTSHVAQLCPKHDCPLKREGGMIGGIET